MTNMAGIFTKSGSAAGKTAPEWPVEPSSKLVDGSERSLITDPKQLQGKVVEVVMVGGSLIAQDGKGLDPLEASPVILHVDRVDTGARGGLEGRVIVSPRQAYPHLKDAFDDAGVDWYFYGKKAFIPANELTKGYSLPECKLVENDDASKWIKRAAKVQRFRDNIARGGSGFLDKLSIPKVLGFTGATTAAAVVAYYAYNRSESRSHYDFEDRSPTPSAAGLSTRHESASEKAKREERENFEKYLDSLSKDEGSKPTVKEKPSQSARSTSRQTSRGEYVTAPPPTSKPAATSKPADSAPESLKAAQTSGLENSPRESKDTAVREGTDSSVKTTNPVSSQSLAKESSPGGTTSPAVETAKQETRNVSASGTTSPTSTQGSQNTASTTSTLSNQVVYTSSQGGTAPGGSTQSGAQLASTSSGTSQQQSSTGSQPASLNGPAAMLMKVEASLAVLPPPGWTTTGPYPEVRLNFWNLFQPDRTTQPLWELVVSRLPATTTPEIYIQRLQQMMNSGRLPGITYAYKQYRDGGYVVAMNLDPRYKPMELLNWVATQTPMY